MFFQVDTVFMMLLALCFEMDFTVVSCFTMAPSSMDMTATLVTNTGVLFLAHALNMELKKNQLQNDTKMDHPVFDTIKTKYDMVLSALGDDLKNKYNLLPLTNRLNQTKCRTSTPSITSTTTIPMSPISPEQYQHQYKDVDLKILFDRMAHQYYSTNLKDLLTNAKTTFREKYNNTIRPMVNKNTMKTQMRQAKNKISTVASKFSTKIETTIKKMATSESQLQQPLVIRSSLQKIIKSSSSHQRLMKASNPLKSLKKTASLVMKPTIIIKKLEAIQRSRPQWKLQ